ncbi:MAG: RdgB/HAM1 family non-canonical purine NTP pyrophosphatase [Candidatus Magnetominusculus sp. LBB02]|nr:RdgB/HAM1 family non-canonical purine NTP pyrophosphatase [Candidatus Magnetominusculus sp. LBB02]
MNLYLATKNAGKVREINGLFEGTGIEFISADGIMGNVAEDGDTYHKNSFAKAMAVYEKSTSPVVAEDSGLEVDALDGAPGVFSARFASNEEGANASDEDNVIALLDFMQDVPKGKRTARFVSVFCLMMDGKSLFFDGEIAGAIAAKPAGISGFGYDPVFVPAGYDKTFAELGSDIKNKISHRAMAVTKLRDYLLTISDSDKK